MLFVRAFLVFLPCVLTFDIYHLLVHQHPMFIPFLYEICEIRFSMAGYIHVAINVRVMKTHKLNFTFNVRP